MKNLTRSGDLDSAHVGDGSSEWGGPATTLQDVQQFGGADGAGGQAVRQLRTDPPRHDGDKPFPSLCLTPVTDRPTVLAPPGSSTR